MSYLEAYGGQEEIDKIEQQLALIPELARTFEERAPLIARIKQIKTTANSNGSRLLTKAEIRGRCDALLDKVLDPEIMDREMAWTITQRFDIPSKVAAYREVAKVKGRINDKLQGEIKVVWGGDRKKKPAEVKKEVEKAITHKVATAKADDEEDTTVQWSKKKHAQK